jgi:ubiquinone/menaquinone biosynthesis C-methylase UbiE
MSSADVERHYAEAARRMRGPGEDQLHVRGAEATVELAGLAALRAGERVLDVGSGLGGPARFLADRFGVDVTGVDVTAAFVERAEELTRDSGVAERVRFDHADATALPFADGAFDVGWTQHAAMNIRRKAALYAELRRTAGRLALYDVLAGDGGPPEYPLPWASVPELSFLVTEDELRALLAAAGFQPTATRDVTEPAKRWLRDVELGPAFDNLGRALDDGRLRLLQLVAA